MNEISPGIDLPKDFYHFNKWLLDTNKEMFEKLLVLYHAYDKLNIAVFINDLNKKKHIWTNDRYYSIIGYTEKEILEMGPEDVGAMFHPDDISLFWKRYEFFKQNKGDSFSSIYRLKHKNGRWVWVYSNCTVFKRDAQNQPTQVLGIAIDFTKDFKTKDRIEDIIKENRNLKSQLIKSSLSDREIEVLGFIVDGNKSSHIAELLNLSEHTVRNHRKNILKKLGLHNTASLVSFAAEHGLRR